MNPVLIFLILLTAVILWFLLSFIFIPLGQFIAKIINNTLNKIFYEETSEKMSKESDFKEERENKIK